MFSKQSELPFSL